ncbi:glycosyltransferase [Candidatus Woesearchaeota archaeon]|nr:glycosyltransferase [Candidatus Woesearchaeota archaeon]MBW3013651.1 glycosyltransferase [Candidatus Woesearchaeota archaeon]
MKSGDFKGYIVGGERHTISLCVITKDEEKFLPNCLEAAKPYVDEIIVVDTGSKDQTVEIAKKYGARVFFTEWKDDFSYAKNKALIYAKGDWILFLDADEVVDTKCMAKIRELVDKAESLGNGKKQIVAYVLHQINYTDETNFFGWKACNHKDPKTKGAKGYYVVPLIRLFRNRSGFKFRYKIHETIVDSIKEKGGRIVKTDIPIYHYSFLKGKDFTDKKIDKYSKLIKEQVKLTPGEPKVHYQMATHYLANRKFEDAKQELKKVIALKPDFDLPYIHLGDLALEKNNVSEAIDYFNKAIEANEKCEVAYVKLAGLLTRMGKFRSAHSILKLAHANGLSSPALINNLGFLFLHTGKVKEAVNIFKQGINRIKSSTDPYYYLLVENLVKAYIESDSRDEAIKILEKAIELNPDNIGQFKNKLEEIKITS